MSYVRKRARTGIFEYRRVIPPELRPFIHQVTGFATKPGRTEFTQSLQTRFEAEANRRGAALDQHVQIGLDDARNRRAKLPRGEGQGQSREIATRVVVVSRTAAFEALDRWKQTEIEASADSAFNGTVHKSLGDEAQSQPDMRYHLQQITLGNANACARIAGFDSVLASVLRSQGIGISEDHPAIAEMRRAFAEAWQALLQAKERMGLRLWDFRPTSAAQETSNEQVEPDVQPEERTPARPFLMLLERWKATAVMQPHQLSMYVSDLKEFEAFQPTLTLDGVSRADVQKWIDWQKVEPKTINRKLSSLRNYWKYVKARALPDGDNRTPFNGLDVPRAKSFDKDGRRIGSKKRHGFLPDDVVRLWREARATGDDQLAMTIRLGAFTGARIESIYGLRPQDLQTDPASQIIFLHFSDKTDAGERDVPVHSAILPCLIKLKDRPTPDGYLLPTTALNHRGQRSAPIGQKFGRLKTKAGFDKRYVFHSLRHTLSIMLEAAGVPETVAAGIVGHQIRSMTHGTYGGVITLRRKQDALEAHVKFPDADFMRG